MLHLLFRLGPILLLNLAGLYLLLPPDHVGVDA